MGFPEARRMVYDQITGGGYYVPDTLNFRGNVLNKSQISNMQGSMANSQYRP
jgi:hypothetical protein